jgi:hypothetical protein
MTHSAALVADADGDFLEVAAGGAVLVLSGDFLERAGCCVAEAEPVEDVLVVEETDGDCFVEAEGDLALRLGCLRLQGGVAQSGRRRGRLHKSLNRTERNAQQNEPGGGAWR